MDVMRIARVLALACLLCAGVASAQTTQLPTREALVTMLSGFEDTPTLAQMRALGDGAVPMLVALYDDPQVIQPVRLRAVEAMGAYTTPAARTFLLRVIREPGQSPIVVREAVEALAQSQGASAIPQIAPLLSSQERAIREGAIEALGSIDTTAARQRLTQHLPDEHDTDLRARIATLTAAH
jgi:HEAT repeat protein